MKSLIAKNHDPEHLSQYDELEVLGTPEHPFIGSIYTYVDGTLDLGTKDTLYYQTKEDAENILYALKNSFIEPEKVLHTGHSGLL